MHQRAGQLDAAAVAARQFAHLAAGNIGQAEPRHDIGEARILRARRQAVQPAVKAQIGAHRDIDVERRLLEHDAKPGQRRHRVAADIVAVNVDGAAIGDEQAAQQLEQRGFAGAVLAEQRHEFAGRHLQADMVERRHVAEALDDILDHQHRCAAVHAASSVLFCLSSPRSRSG